MALHKNLTWSSEFQGAPMSTKLKAKQAVALKMCEILHKKGKMFMYILGRNGYAFRGYSCKK